MARRRQEGNLFFRLDVDFFSDRKVKILKARYGADGITLYLYLLCEIYKIGYYLKIDEDFEYIVSDDLNMESNKVKQVLNFLLERSLFDNTLFQSDKVLTSAGIQRRYQAKQYKHEMEDIDHEALLKTILKSKSKIMISGYESDMYEDYLSKWKKRTFMSCAEGGSPRKETIWMNYIPNSQISMFDYER